MAEQASDSALQRRGEQLNDQFFGGLAMPNSVSWVTNQNSRWGSCTPVSRTIRLSHRLQEMPQYVVDYVLVHELAHLLEANHSAEFWKWVDRYPQAEKAKGYLEGFAAGSRESVELD